MGARSSNVVRVSVSAPSSPSPNLRRSSSAGQLRLTPSSPSSRVPSSPVPVIVAVRVPVETINHCPQSRLALSTGLVDCLVIAAPERGTDLSTPSRPPASCRRAAVDHTEHGDVVATGRSASSNGCRRAAVDHTERGDVVATGRSASSNGTATGASVGSNCMAAPDMQTPHALAPRIFRRALTISELAQIKELLEPTAQQEFRNLAEKEFDWALSINGHVPGSPGRVDYASAATAVRQLTYLHGLPALETDAVRWCFDVHDDLVADPNADNGSNITLARFHAGW